MKSVTASQATIPKAEVALTGYSLKAARIYERENNSTQRFLRIPRFDRQAYVRVEIKRADDRKRSEHEMHHQFWQFNIGETYLRGAVDCRLPQEAWALEERRT
jgi:hypothetical protein